jgi:hypothetical protein
MVSANQYSSVNTYLSNKDVLMLLSSSSSSTSSDVRCEQCGMIFTTLQDKEEDIKLEHKEHQKPTGVS